MNVTWPHFDQSAEQLVLGHMTNKNASFHMCNITSQCHVRAYQAKTTG